MANARRPVGGRFLLLVLLMGFARSELACTKQEKTEKDKTASAALQIEVPPAAPSKTTGASGPAQQAVAPSEKETSRETLTEPASGKPAEPVPKSPDAAVREALKALFPGSDWAEDCAAGDKKELCLRPVKKDGFVGCILWSGVRYLIHWENLAVVGFELFLSKAASPVLALGGEEPPDAALKAVNVVFLDTAKGKVVAPFPSFPIEDSVWFCHGDICSVPGLVDIKDEGLMEGCGYYRVTYAQGSSHFVRFYGVCANQSVEAQGDAFPYGDLGGETGCLRHVEYKLALEYEGPVTLMRTTSCDRKKECISMGDCRPGTVAVMRDGKPVETTAKYEDEGEPKGLQTRIRFKSGSSTGIVKESVVRGERNRHLIRAGKGQNMRVSISSLESNASFNLVQPDGKIVESAEGEQDLTSWSGKLPISGDYIIVVGPNRGNATYQLEVTIKN